MSLENYWPISQEINRCINHEAEGAHDAVLLAVHQPTPLSYRLISSDRKVEANEEDLFKYLTSDDVPSGALVVPITGASGVGKSHMVRVLAARLQSINIDGRYVIIQIPKSASLRSVVESILEKLPGDEYSGVRAGFSKAVSEVNIESAAISFQSELNIALIELAKELKAKVAKNPDNAALKEQFGHAMNLPKFMGDAALVDYFHSQVFPRIVKRAVSGQNVSEFEESAEDFRANDFAIPESIDIAKAAETTRRYYQLNLQIRDGEGRRNAVRLLNESKVVDQAIRQLFKLHESLGGMTLQEVIQTIRRLLRKQNRELVVLVEDFKALTGIQDTLLNILIQHAQDGNEGKNEDKKMATIRSVIAVTNGYIDGKDTIASRANREWIVESNLSGEVEVLRRTKALVAAYLNAARWGYDELVRQFKQRSSTWLDEVNRARIYAEEDDERDLLTLKAFGQFNGIPLFPYTELAIEQLARAALTRNNIMVFTPRFIIDTVLRSLLLSGRLAYVQNRFPHAGLDAPRVNATVTDWLMSRIMTTEVKDRYVRVIGIWGNNPKTVADIGFIPKEVFDAFGLDRPDVETRKQSTGSNIEVQGTRELPPPTPPTPTPVDDVLTALEEWVDGTLVLGQTIANRIRTSIASALNDRIEWQAERCNRVDITARLISIPKSAGEGNMSVNCIRVAADNSDPTGQVRFELAAVCRHYHTNRGRSDYAGADEDLMWVGNLADRLLPQALALVRASVKQKLAMSLSLLSTNSQILGLTERARTTTSLSPFLFGVPEITSRISDSAPSEFSDWRGMQETAVGVRRELIQMVLSYCGSFQGDGKTAYAVDITRILESMPVDGEAIDFSVLDLVTPEIRQLLIPMAENRAKAMARKVLQSAIGIRKRLTVELGEVFEKQVVVDELRELADQLKETGQFNADEIGLGHQAFMNLCEEFRKSALSASLTTLANATDDIDGPNSTRSAAQFLSNMGRFNGNPLLTATRFVEVARKLVNLSAKRVRTLEEQVQGVNPQIQASRIQDLMTGLKQEISSMGKKGESTCF